MGKYAVEYHAPNIAQHYAAYQVRHEEHGAEQIGALYALCQHISYRKSKHVDYYEGYQCEYGRIPEGMHERRVRNRLCIVGQPHPRPFAGGLEFTEG